MKQIIFLAILLIAGCSSVTIVSTNPKEGLSLANYKTFDFYQLNTEQDMTPTFRTRVDWIKSEIAKQLSSRGLQQTSENPDLLVNLGVVVEEKIQTRETTIQDAPRYMGQRNYSWQSQEVPVGEYQEGTVTVDLVDAKENTLAWQGVASSVIVKSDKSSQKNIADGIGRLFAEVK